MKLSELKKILNDNGLKPLRFILPTGTKIPIHAHITEVAKVEKQFIDCGGTFRKEALCRLQIWFAEDTDHRPTARMLVKILEKSSSFLGTENLDVDVEYETPFVSQFPILEVDADDEVVTLRLGTRHTACLAEDRCLPPAKVKTPTAFKPLPELKVSKCC
jgi:hypothetical protein